MNENSSRVDPAGTDPPAPDDPDRDAPATARPDDVAGETISDDAGEPAPHWMERGSGGGGGLRALAWTVVGLILGAVLFLDPLGIHPVDGWLQGALGLEPAAGGERRGEPLFYRNPMDPTITSPEPTKDEMGMDYVPVYADEAGGGGAAGRGEPLFYRNPMDPTITSPEPIKDEMGMDYVPVYADELGEAQMEAGTVVIDPVMVQNMNVVTALVERGDVERAIRTVGYLDYDQQRMVTVTTKYRGFIERVYVNYVGEPVRAGQPLFEIYSPELVQTQEELLSAIAFAEQLAGSSADSRRRAEALAEAARQRLSYWDIAPEQIELLEESGRSLRTLTVTAPKSGLVMKRMPGLEGMAASPGMELFHIADLSALWLSVEVFEDQLPWLREGSEAEITLPYFPGEVFRGRVRYVEPQVNEATRTVGLRLEVPNPDGKLRAGMYATVRFAPVLARDVLSVPAQAVIRTGERNVVIVALGEGKFAPRDVLLGPEGDRTVAVLSGIAAGERVVTSSHFLLDSESNLRAAILELLQPEAEPENHSGTDHPEARHSEREEPTGGEYGSGDAGDNSTMEHSPREPPRRSDGSIDHADMGHGDRVSAGEPVGAPVKRRHPSGGGAR
ncbi:MAG TPA: efflux RND transporter periplasmic adaptor subunit [Thermoanaerobaculia bacterium]|nr:efflux RND transporter periplasmic adaptor subunit [Thermoanaerobaculia bacterium]